MFADYTDFSYWKLVHPQWPVLDPALHKLTYVRTRSAFLTTTILALGSTSSSALSLAPNKQVTEALSLHGHVEKLKLVVFASGARSIEIIQAKIVTASISFPSHNANLCTASMSMVCLSKVSP